MLLTSRGRFAGYGFSLLKGKPVFLWSLVDLERLKWQKPDAPPPGRHALECAFVYDGLGIGTPAFHSFSGVGQPSIGTLKVGGAVVTTKRMDHTLPKMLQWDESFDIGSDALTGVHDSDYEPPFTFTGTLHTLKVKFDRPQLSPEDCTTLEDAMQAKDGPASPAACSFARHHPQVRAAPFRRLCLDASPTQRGPDFRFGAAQHEAVHERHP